MAAGSPTWWRSRWWAVLAVLVVVGVVAWGAWLLRPSGDAPVARPEATTATSQPSPTPTQAATPAPTATPERSPAPAGPSPTAQPTPQPTTPEPAPESPEPVPGLADASYGPFSHAPDIVGTADSWIADVRSAGHQGYDRVVFEFTGSYVPWYRVGVTPTQGPFYDIPGALVPIEGKDFLEVWLQGTSRVDMTHGYTPVYTGPTRLRPDTTVVTEVVEIEDFEANVRWVVGLRQKKPFTVWTLEGPSRLVIDVEQ